MTIEVSGCDIPVVSIGTSPFLGAGQFGVKAVVWRRRFLSNPVLMADLMTAAYRQGATGVHVIPYGSIGEAVRLVKERYPDFVVMGSTVPHRADGGLNELVNMGSRLVFVHGSIADRRDEGVLRRWFEEIRLRDCIPGVATHEPVRTISFLEEKELECEVVLLPFNLAGYAMEDKEKLEEIVDGLNISFVAMKALAAGRIRPRRAFQYISKHNISAVTVGLTSLSEVRETVDAALQFLGKRK